MGYEVKARTTTELLDGTFQLYRNHFATFMKIVLPAYGLIFSISMAVNKSLTHQWAPPAKNAHPTTHQLIAGISTGLMQALFVGFALYFLLVAVAVAFSDGELTYQTVMARAKQSLAPYWTTAIRQVMLIMLAFLCFIIPGLIVSLNWMLMPQVVVFEPTMRGAEALDRSKKLVYGQRGRNASLLFFLQLLAGFLGGFIGGVAQVAAPVAGIALTLLVQALFSPLVPCFLTLAYIDARVRKEGYDMEIMAQRSGNAAVASMTPSPSA